MMTKQTATMQFNALMVLTTFFLLWLYLFLPSVSPHHVTTATQFGSKYPIKYHPPATYKDEYLLYMCLDYSLILNWNQWSLFLMVIIFSLLSSHISINSPFYSISQKLGRTERGNVEWDKLCSFWAFYPEKGMNERSDFATLTIRPKKTSQLHIFLLWRRMSNRFFQSVHLPRFYAVFNVYREKKISAL